MNVQRLKQELLAQKENKLKGNIYHFSQVNFSYNSNRIEGSKLTKEETEQIFNTSNLIIDNDDTIELIHPFSDSNGRVGRIIMYKECLKNNIIPFIILNEHKNFYLRGLKEYSKDKLYLIDTIKTEQDIYQKICKELFLIN